MKKPTICISIGDVNGIGPEVVLKTLGLVDLSSIHVLLFTNQNVIDFYLDKIDNSLPDSQLSRINIIDPNPETTISPTPGALQKEAGLHAMKSIEKGIEYVLKQKADALVTAPISKDAVNQAGYAIPGHTEFLAERTDTDEVLMTLVSDRLRVALVTTHIPISEVASQLSQKTIIGKARLLHTSLKQDFGVEDPRIAVFGLNPHAGDGGVIGMEEIEIIEPAIQLLKESGIEAEGPFPADGFFGSNIQKHFDGILAMYHDQGLVPFKALSFGSGVNFTAGLPIIRTSPDHGTAFGIAGKGIADPSSFMAAFELAVQLAKRRHSH